MPYTAKLEYKKRWNMQTLPSLPSSRENDRPKMSSKRCSKMKEIVLAAFSIHKRNSLAYRRYQTVEGFAKGISEIIKKLEPDYISVRIIKEQTK